MPVVKYGFAPTDGEFQGVRSFGRQVKHLAATNHILTAVALSQEVPPDAAGEAGPETVRTNAEVLNYMLPEDHRIGAGGDRSYVASPGPAREVGSTCRMRKLWNML